jgi:hypothetical protein
MEKCTNVTLTLTPKKEKIVISNHKRELGGFTAVMFQVEVFWFVTPCSVVVGYRRFRGPCYLYPEDGDSMYL